VGAKAARTIADSARSASAECDEETCIKKPLLVGDFILQPRASHVKSLHKFRRRFQISTLQMFNSFIINALRAAAESQQLRA
jgi:hypothetical protein